jgi:hypothetical protein
MGTIFTNATRVDIWLGELPRAIIPLKKVLRKHDEYTSGDWLMVRSNKAVLDKYLIHNEYWSRAWITQEVVLACRAVVWLDTDLIGLKELITGIQYFDLDQGALHVKNFARNWWKGFERPQALIPLLAYFRDKRCHDPRDRIFSLLSLVSGEDKNLGVNYNISMASLAAKILHHCKDSIYFCSAILIAQTLGLADATVLPAGQGEWQLPCLEFDVTGYSLKPDVPWSRCKDCYYPVPGYRKLCSRCAEQPSVLEEHILDLFTVRDTCPVMSWACYEIRLDESHKRLMRRTNLMAPHPRVALGDEDEFDLKSEDILKTILTIRLPLYDLTKMMAGPVKLCPHAKGLPVKPRFYQLDRPRICYVKFDRCNYPPFPPPGPTHILSLGHAHRTWTDYSIENFIPVGFVSPEDEEDAEVGDADVE